MNSNNYFPNLVYPNRLSPCGLLEQISLSYLILPIWYFFPSFPMMVYSSQYLLYLTRIFDSSVKHYYYSGCGIILHGFCW